jgi:tripartite-type tricarboxylate transporter receptor subunit TctC
MIRAAGCAALFVFALAAEDAWPQGYPAKPIRMVIPATPGGGSELMARLVGQKFTEAWGQPVVVEPRPGAGGTIGAEFVARAAPDGYTLLMCFSSFTVTPSLFKSIAYNTERDFAPVSLVAKQSNVLLVHPSVPVRTMNELLVLAKSRPDGLNYASAGSGSGQHLGMELLKMVTGMKLMHIPYKGSAPALVDVVGGQVAMMFHQVRVAKPMLDAGRLRGLAQTGSRRSPLIPDIPTLEEAGVRGVEFTTWHGLLAPAGTPTEIVGRLNAEVRRAFGTPEMKARMVQEDAEVVASSPAEFADFIRLDIARWAKVVQAAGVRVN